MFGFAKIIRVLKNRNKHKCNDQDHFSNDLSDAKKNATKVMKYSF
jgi:hypothetical protein